MPNDRRCARRGWWALGWVAALMVSHVWAGEAPAAPQRLVHLSAQASERVNHDWVTVALQTRAQASDAAAVQAQLAETLRHALAALRARAPGEGVELSTGAFVVQPRYGREGQIVGWQGSAEIVVQGRDVAALAALAQSAPGMAVASVRMGVAPTTQQAAQVALRRRAIEAFRRQADEVAQAFGARGWVLHEANGGNLDAGSPPPVLRAATLAVGPAEAAPLPLEPGQGTLSVTVSGSIALQ